MIFIEKELMELFSEQARLEEEIVKSVNKTLGTIKIRAVHL